MSNNKTDISLIQKYLKGELDAKAMHQLERRALDDPFLMEALEGYESAHTDQEHNLNEMADRLRQRLSGPGKKILPLWVMSAAASVLIIVAVGGVWLLNRQPDHSARIANITKRESLQSDTVSKVNKPSGIEMAPPVAPKDNVESIAASGLVKMSRPDRVVSSAKQQAVVSNGLGYVGAPAATKEAEINPALKTDTTPLNEMIVMNYAVQRKKDIKVDSTVLKHIPAAGKVTLITSKVEGLSINPPDRRHLNSPEIAGLVSAMNSGLPIAGARVRMEGTDKSAVTDAYGRFVLPVDSSRAKLTVGREGYKSQQVDVANKAPVKIVLQTAANDEDKLKKGNISTYSVSPVTAGVKGKRDLAVFNNAFGKKTIKGRIIDKSDQTPIPGATVKVVGANSVAVTDQNGYFNLSADTTKVKLLVAYIGYKSQQLNASNKNPLQIELEPNSSSLNEVVVVGKSADVVREAHPLDGWKAYKAYLQDNAVSADGKTGAVKLAFMVSSSGEISDIKIIKGLSNAADAKAKELVEHSTVWVGNTNGKAEKVRLTIRFKKK